MANLVMSILMLAAFFLLGGAFVLWRMGGRQKQVFLMIVAGLVMLGNVAIWSIPTKTGASLSDRPEPD